MRFSDGTVLDDFHALGYLAKGNTYCEAPIRLTGSSSEPVRYWAVGKNCCDRRLGSSQLYFRKPGLNVA